LWHNLVAAWLQVEKVVRAALSRHGRLDGVVNCIGNVAAASALATEVQQLQQDLQVGLHTEHKS
jgi:NAD(P)-dependent dehydrogenase (short-subunit alcohol dehydrogenase family)